MSRRLVRRIDLTAVVSAALFTEENGRPGLPLLHGSAVLPCGPDLSRFEPMPRAEARRELGLDPGGRYLLFPANPARPEKRADRARELAEACEAELLSGGAIEPDRMRLWINAANAVLVTSDYEGLGMICIEALACRVPILSTPVGIAPFLLDGRRGHALRRLRARRPGRRPSCRTWSPPTRGSTAPGGPRGSPRRGPRSARSRPTATFSPPRNRFVLR